jgi:hypothetical protein
VIEDDRAANRFIEDIKSNLTKDSQGEPTAPAQPAAHITINRAVRCTIVIGQAPDATKAPRHKGR